jgi:hypothetical protein
MPPRLRERAQVKKLDQLPSAIPHDDRVSLGLVPGVTHWNKFGYNPALNISTREVLASFGNAFNQRLTNAEQLNIVSTSANDTNSSGTGIRQLILYGVGGDAAGDRDHIIEIIALNGTTTVTTTKYFWGVNRMTTFSSGTSNSNEGTITATASTSGNTMAEMPYSTAGMGTTQQMIFYTGSNHIFLTKWLHLHVVKSSGGGGNPDIDFYAYVYSEVVDSVFEIFHDDIDLGSRTFIDLNSPLSFIIGEKSILWWECITSGGTPEVRGRMDGHLHNLSLL